MPHFCTGHRTSPRPHPPLYPQAKKSHQASCSAVPRPLHNQMPPAAPGALSATRTTTAPEFQSLTGHVSAPCSPWNTAANALPPPPPGSISRCPPHPFLCRHPHSCLQVPVRQKQSGFPSVHPVLPALTPPNTFPSRYENFV